jgi:uncharacterized protein YbaR (Trm112 family)
MSRIAAIKDYREFAVMIGGLLEDAGHEVLRDSPPVDWERLVDFDPDLVVIGFFRRRTAYNRAIEDFDRDILGGETLRAIESYPAIRVKPILAIGNGVEAREIPNEFRFDAFVYFPDEMGRFLPTVDELARKDRRRSFSAYQCPVCHARLTYAKQNRKELFCPRCHTGVSILDEVHCMYQARALAPSQSCLLADLERR